VAGKMKERPFQAENGVLQYKCGFGPIYIMAM